MTKVLNAGELVLIIVRDNGVAKCHCVRRNEQIIPIKIGRPGLLEPRANHTVHLIGGNFER